MYNIKNTNIGKILNEARKLNNLTLDDVGKIIYKTKATVSKYEKNEILPDIPTLLELCNLLKIDIATFFPQESSETLKSFPFNTNKLYLYYMTNKKFIFSIIEIYLDGNIYKARLYNGIKDDPQNCAYYYEGSVEYSDFTMYIDLKSIHSLKLEKVQLIVNIPLSKNTAFLNCFITGLTPNYIPVIKRGLISFSPLLQKDMQYKNLAISKEEIKQISNDNNWILSNKLYDEFFYDYNEKAVDSLN